VHYVKRNFLGGRRPTPITQANQDGRVWCNTTAGQRIHGTTKEQPLVRFRETEQARLKPLPEAPYDLAIWKVVKLHRDCHIVSTSLLLGPFRCVGQPSASRRRRHYASPLWTTSDVPSRAARPGQRHRPRLPAYKVMGLVLRATCLPLAADIGRLPNVAATCCQIGD
jgi:hypothetical protein